MTKRLMAFAMLLAVTISGFAYSFSGKTYKREEDGGSFTVKFTSLSKLLMIFKEKGKPAQTKSARYEVSGEVVNVYVDGGSDYFYIDTDQEYGEDSIYLLDPYGNVYIVLDYVATPANSTTPKKTTATKKRKK